MDPLTGRTYEKQLLTAAFKEKGAKLYAIYGRRRVGKTFLVRTVFEKNIVFEFAGIHNAPLRQQLQNFSQRLQTASANRVPLAVPKNWVEAFFFLEQQLTPVVATQKSVIFLDEFPWIHTPKSNFLEAFAGWWNSWASRQDNLVVVICGSAASWMLRHVINSRGGLHNRISQKIRLLPFTLSETKAYLRSKRVILDHYEILQLYMAMGGIPEYLKTVQPDDSATTAINRACFTKDGILRTEFKTLYQSLFDNGGDHVSIVKALAAKGKGMNRNEIIRACHLKTGGGTTTLLTELEESGFISSYVPFGKAVKDTVYKLSDEYSLFYLRFIEHNKPGKDVWNLLAARPSWRSWSGVAFESICLKHTEQLKKALGIGGVQTSESVWRHTGKEKGGAQIDLLIERGDRAINLCEMKYAETEFTISQSYASELKSKREVFREVSGTRKTIFLTMITTYGIRKNIYYAGLVQKDLTMDVLFK